MKRQTRLTFTERGTMHPTTVGTPLPPNAGDRRAMGLPDVDPVADVVEELPLDLVPMSLIRPPWPAPKTAPVTGNRAVDFAEARKLGQRKHREFFPMNNEVESGEADARATARATAEQMIRDIRAADAKALIKPSHPHRGGDHYFVFDRGDFMPTTPHNVPSGYEVPGYKPPLSYEAFDKLVAAFKPFVDDLLVLVEAICEAAGESPELQRLLKGTVRGARSSDVMRAAGKPHYRAVFVPEGFELVRVGDGPTSFEVVRPAVPAKRKPIPVLIGKRGPVTDAPPTHIYVGPLLVFENDSTRGIRAGDSIEFVEEQCSTLAVFRRCEDGSLWSLRDDDVSKIRSV